MRAGFSHLPVKHDLNKSNMMIFYKCRKIFLFRSSCYTLLLYSLLHKSSNKRIPPSSPPTSGAETVSERRAVRLKTIILTDCKLQMLIFVQLMTRKVPTSQLLYNCYSNSFKSYNCLCGPPYRHVAIINLYKIMMLTGSTLSQ